MKIGNFYLSKKVLKNEAGVTLTELLIFLVITAFLSLGISRLITDAAVGLDRASQESVAARQVIRFSNTLKYDISGATDVIVLPEVPLATDPVCTFTDMKSLFTVRIRTLVTPTEDPARAPKINGENPYDNNPSSRLATYGLYNDNTGASIKWYIKRVTCAPTSMATPLNSENLMDLGSSISARIVGKNVLLCDGLPELLCPESTSTTKVKSYKFKFPFSAKFSTLKNFNLVQTLTRRIDEG